MNTNIPNNVERAARNVMSNIEDNYGLYHANLTEEQLYWAVRAVLHANQDEAIAYFTTTIESMDEPPSLEELAAYFDIEI